MLKFLFIVNDYISRIKRQNGPTESFYRNGQLEFNGNYQDGKQEGPWEFFHNNAVALFDDVLF